MVIKNDGSVGIGTTNPWYKLDVRGPYMGVGLNGTANSAIEVGEVATASHSAYIDLTGDTTYTDFGLRLLRDDGGANTDSELVSRGTGTLTIKTYEAGPLAFSTTDTERMRISAGGYVGIGTTSPSSTLDVVSTATTGTAANIAASSVTSGYGLTISANGLTTGAVSGISSSSTAGGASGNSYVQKLARAGANANASHTAYGLYSTVTNTGTTSTNVAGYFSASGGSSNYGLLVPNGYVGLGTTISNGSLDVRGTYNAPTTGNGLAYFYTNDTQAANVGASLVLGGRDGTIADRAFGIIGGFKENGTSGNYAGYLGFHTRPNGTVPVEAMRITSAGYV